MALLRNALLPGCVAACAAGVAVGQASLPLDAGDIVATCHSGYPYNPANVNAFTVVVYDATDPVGQGAPLDANWQPPATHNETAPLEHIWNVRNTGEVFGVTLDDALAPNIYVTATTVYGQIPFGPGGGGGVYRIDGVTGNVSVFASLPNSGPGLGNIAFDELHDQFYVSNHEDGLIYRLDSGGVVQSTYDHGVAGRAAASLPPIPDDPMQAFTQLGRRVWGLEEYRGRLYYAVWWEDIGCAPYYLTTLNPGRPCPAIDVVDNEIWSVAIDPVSGDFVPNSAMLEVTMENQPGATNLPDMQLSSPVSDIEFSKNGHMITGQRSMLRDTGRGTPSGHPGSPWDAHRGIVRELRGSSGSWTFEPLLKYRIGWVETGAANQNCWNNAGGVSWDCDENVWATGDALHFNCPVNIGRYVYGAQRVPTGGNATAAPRSTSTSYLIDFDNFTSGGGFVNKTQLGDIVAYDPGCSCAIVETKRLECPMEAGSDTLSWTFNVVNNSGLTAEHIFLTPVSGGDFLDQTIDIPTLLDGETSAPIKAEITGAEPGGRFCFLVTLLTADLEDCCTVEVCLDIPECDCFVTLEESIECDPNNPGKYIYTATLRNLTNGPVYHVYTVPPTGVMMMDDHFDFSSSPIPPFGTFQIQTQIMGGTPGEVLCFLVSLHDEGLMECCSEEVCVTLPVCDDGFVMDRCDSTRIAMCCPQTGVATITATICNDGTGVHSYAWSIDGLPPSGSCTVQLPPAAFTPSGGTVGPLAPGSCATVTIQVSCGELHDGLPMTCSNYGITFTNQTNGQQLLCSGIVKRSDGLVIKEIGPGETDVPMGGAAFVRYSAENAGDQPIMATVSVQDINPDGDFDGFWLSLNDQQEGTPVEVPIDLEPFGMTEFEVGVRFTSGEVGQTDQVYVSVPDMDGDGAPELLAASSVRLVDPDARCFGDANGDGVVDFTDLNAVLAQFGAAGPGLVGDLNADGMVNFTDLNEVLSTFGDMCD